MKIDTNSGLLQRAILSTIILSAAHSWAQAQYSANAIGYADVNLVAGSNLVANPFNAGNNTISNLFRGVPDGAVFLAWNKASQTFPASNVYHSATGWTDPNATLVLPHGAFLVMPSPLKISFVGDISTPVNCHSYGASDLTIMPNGFCGFCDPGPCPSPVPDFTSLSKWNPTGQNWDYYIYLRDFGWVDSNVLPVNSPLEPGEPGMFFPSEPFTASFLRIGFGTIFTPPARITSWQRNNSDLTLQMPGSSSMGYTLLHSTNISGNWTVISNGIATASNGNLIVRAPITSNVAGFYKISALAQPALLINPVRTGTQFQFQFYAAQGVSYTVQRALLPDSTSWGTISTVTGNGDLKTVTDATATAPTGYYRLRF
jgi:hypothetical protein